jgi:hypothetical protein
MMVQQATDFHTSETAGVKFQIGHGPEYDLSEVGGRTRTGTTQIKSETVAYLSAEELTRDYVGQLAKKALEDGGA